MCDDYETNEITIDDINTKLNEMDTKLTALDVKLTALDQTTRLNIIEECLKKFSKMFEDYINTDYTEKAKREADANDIVTTSVLPASNIRKPRVIRKTVSKSTTAMPIPIAPVIAPTTPTIPTMPTPTMPIINVATPTAAKLLPAGKSTPVEYFQSLFNKPKDEVVKILTTINNIAIEKGGATAACQYDIEKLYDMCIAVEDIDKRNKYAAKIYKSLHLTLKKAVGSFKDKN